MKYKLKFNLHDIFASFISLGIVFIFIVISIISIPKSNSEDYAVIRYNNKIVKKMPLSIDEDFIMLKKDYPDLYGDMKKKSVSGKKRRQDQKETCILFILFSLLLLFRRNF